MVQILQFSKYLSGFVQDRQIEYSAVGIMVRWINEALKTPPPGSERVVVLAKKLDSFFRLSSGRGFYDIWNAFLTDVTPPTTDQSLEVLEKVCSIGGDTGKESSSKYAYNILKLPRFSKPSFPICRPLHPPSRSIRP
jgi:hypothetical protein